MEELQHQQVGRYVMVDQHLQGQNGTNAGQGAQGAVGAQGSQPERLGQSNVKVLQDGSYVMVDQRHICSSSFKRIVLPDLEQEFIVGAGNNYSRGDTGGADSVTLTTAQMPQHNHGINDPGHFHTTNDYVARIRHGRTMQNLET